MLRSEARVPTEKAEQYANRLCKHFAHQIPAEWTPPEGLAEFPDLGACRLSAGPGELAISIEAYDADALARVQEIVGSHLERFGAREGLRVGWSEPSGEPSRSKTPGLDPKIYGYMRAHSTPPDEVGRGLIEDTWREAPELAGMQIAPEQGAFLTMLTRLSGARFAVELGTFTGYSALCIARGLPPDGKLLTVDVDERASYGKPYWEDAGVAGRIELRIGDAKEVLRSLPEEPRVDLAFVDADKEGYPAYHEELLGRLSPNGLILYDNTLAEGGVLDDGADDWIAAMKDFNEMLAADERVEKVLLPIGDGLTLVQRSTPRSSPNSREE